MKRGRSLASTAACRLPLAPAATGTRRRLAPSTTRRRLAVAATVAAGLRLILCGLAASSVPAAAARSTLALGPDDGPDAKLVDADGRPVRWRDDVLGRHPVVVNFVFTSCTTFCPTTSALMSHLHERLAGDGTVRLVSLSLDPLTDTPQRLREFARSYRPGPHWRWLTGAPGEVFPLLEALQAGTGGDPSSHAPLWLVGRRGKGAWRRAYGLPTIERLQSLLDALA